MGCKLLTYAPNISWLFKELPFAERPGAVGRAGFEALELGFLSPEKLPVLLTARDVFGLQIVLFNQDVPGFDECNRGYMADPALREMFKRRLDEALFFARQLNARKVMLCAGAVVPGMPRKVQYECIVENLRYAGPLAAETGVILTIEVLNSHDMPEFFLNSTTEAIEIIKDVDHPAVKFQFDSYHIQVGEGNLISKLENYKEWIGHIQFGDVPGRLAPGSGEINFANLHRAIEGIGYSGYIGLEYKSDLPGDEALAWVPDALRHPKNLVDY